MSEPSDDISPRPIAQISQTESTSVQSTFLLANVTLRRHGRGKPKPIPNNSSSPSPLQSPPLSPLAFSPQIVNPSRAQAWGYPRRSHGRQQEAAGRDRPRPQEGPGGRRRLRQHLEQGSALPPFILPLPEFFPADFVDGFCLGAGLRHWECQPEGEVRGGPQEGDQEAAAV